MSDRDFLNPRRFAERRQAALEGQRLRREQDELARVKADHRRRYLATPGATLEAFEAAWPAMLEQHRQQVAMGTETAPANPLADPKRWGLSR